jgi:hypothetical protein
VNRNQAVKDLFALFLMSAGLLPLGVAPECLSTIGEPSSSVRRSERQETTQLGHSRLNKADICTFAHLCIAPKYNVYII